MSAPLERGGKKRESPARRAGDQRTRTVPFLEGGVGASERAIWLPPAAPGDTVAGQRRPCTGLSPLGRGLFDCVASVSAVAALVKRSRVYRSRWLFAVSRQAAADRVKRLRICAPIARRQHCG